VTTRPGLAGLEAERHPGPLGEQVATPGRDPPQLSDGGVDVQRFRLT
jgi:hypothetical protein